MKRLASLFLILTMVACLFGGASAEEAPKDSVTIVTQVTPDSLDPQSTNMLYAMQVYMNCYDSLTIYNAEGQLVGNLAESWQGNDDCSEFTMKLREGVTFHNGEPFTSADVVFTVNRGIEKGVNDFAVIASCEALSDYEVKFTLTKPYAPFPRLMATERMGMLNEKAVTEAGDSFGRSPVGTGPYKFVEWVEGEYITLEANADYFNGAPAIQNVKYRFISDENTAQMALESGEADFTYVLPAIATYDIEANEDLSLIQYESSTLQFCSINTQKDILSNKLVRQAINYAINRDELVMIASEGNGTPSSQYCGSATFGHIDGLEGYTYDVDKAKELMAEAGYPDGGFTIKVTVQDALTNKEATVMADNLAQIGITLEIEMLESNTAVANFIAGEYEIGVLGMANPMLDADYLLSNLLGFEAPLNLSKLNDQELADAITAAAQILDETERLAAYEKIYETIWDEAPYIPLFYPLRSLACSSKLTVSRVPSTGLVRAYDMAWA